jgi:hypothetical protein
MPDTPIARVGDKVRVKSGSDGAGMRGVVRAVGSRGLTVHLNTGKTTEYNPPDVCNYSLAARKAWMKMPGRRVGRPKGSRQCDRISVTLRFEKALWHRFLLLEKEGKTGARVELFNRMLTQIVSRSGQARTIASVKTQEGPIG